MARVIEEVKGHETQWAWLLKTMAENRLPHALALNGPSGIGKRQVALKFTQAGVCRGTDIPCGECGDCKRAGVGQHESIMLVQPTGAMSGLKIDQAHAILGFLSLRSLSKRRFVIVDDAVQMNTAFGNALLKVLEEPPSNVHFIFIVQAMSQLLPTIRSRLQSVRFFYSQTDGLEKWREESAAEIKNQALAALLELANQKTDDSALFERVKERESAETGAAFLQQFFRDAYLRKISAPGIVHADCEKAFQAWSRYTGGQLLELWREAHRLSGNVASNLDRVLSYEVFFQRGRHILENT